MPRSQDLHSADAPNRHASDSRNSLRLEPLAPSTKHQARRAPRGSGARARANADHVISDLCPLASHPLPPSRARVASGRVGSQDVALRRHHGLDPLGGRRWIARPAPSGVSTPHVFAPAARQQRARTNAEPADEKQRPNGHRRRRCHRTDETRHGDGNISSPPPQPPSPLPSSPHPQPLSVRPPRSDTGEAVTSREVETQPLGFVKQQAPGRRPRWLFGSASQAIRPGDANTFPTPGSEGSRKTGFSSPCASLRGRNPGASSQCPSL